ncbi:hypothetical protein J6590_085284 [Homalodisca vitripennis]|nr:hypothetical protein J6590_085284 [Homalodisca vitripennis]
MVVHLGFVLQAASTSSSTPVGADFKPITSQATIGPVKPTFPAYRKIHVIGNASGHRCGLGWPRNSGEDKNLSRKVYPILHIVPLGEFCSHKIFEMAGAGSVPIAVEKEVFTLGRSCPVHLFICSVSYRAITKYIFVCPDDKIRYTLSVKL